MELTRQAPLGSLETIEGYGEGGFTVSGSRHRGSILVLPDSVTAWPAEDFADLSLSSLQPVIDASPAIELLIIGCGSTLSRLPLTLCELLRSKGISVEAMDTGAACRTYNVLAGEGRRVAAALIAL